MTMQRLRINTEVALCRASTSSKNLNRWESSCRENIIRHTESAFDKFCCVGNLVQISNMLSIRVMDYFTIFAICQPPNSNKICTIAKGDSRIAYNIIVLMASQTINQFADAHSFVRSCRRMSADKHSKCVWVHFFDRTSKLYIVINRRCTGIKHK